MDYVVNQKLHHIPDSYIYKMVGEGMSTKEACLLYVNGDTSHQPSVKASSAEPPSTKAEMLAVLRTAVEEACDVECAETGKASFSFAYGGSSYEVKLVSKKS